MKTIYAVGDLHGEFEKLRAMCRQIATDAAGRTGEKLGVFLGDYIDRGPDSRSVVELLMSGNALPFPYICLMGNHEEFALDGKLRGLWISEKNGGAATLASFGGEIPPEVKAWLSSLPLSHRDGSWLFVHAGVNPFVSLSDQPREAMLWSRYAYDGPYPEGVTVVHGHTPGNEVEIGPHRINLDTGACFGGNLSCAILTDKLEGFLYVGGPKRHRHQPDFAALIQE